MINDHGHWQLEASSHFVSQQEICHPIYVCDQLKNNPKNCVILNGK